MLASIRRLGLAAAVAAGAAGCSHPQVESPLDRGSCAGSSPCPPGGSSSGTSGASGTSGGASGGSSGAAGGSTSGATGGGSSSGSASSGGSTSGGAWGGVLQRGNDAARDAVFVDPAFTKANVASLHLDASFTSATWQGPVFAQPLYFVDAAIGKDLLVVATEQNEVVALDAATGSALWRRTLGPPVTDFTTMACPGSIAPLGITGTPVIDPGARTLFVAALTVVAGKPHHEVWALHLDDGTIAGGWPVDVEGATAKLTDGTVVTFQSSVENQRGALLLSSGTLFVPYGGLWGDCGPYRGWIAALSEEGPSLIETFATDAPGCGFWAPGGLAAAPKGAVIGGTGNAIDDAEAHAWGGGEAVIEFSGPMLGFNPADDQSFYARSDYAYLDQNDLDLGSTAPIRFDFDDPLTGRYSLLFTIGKTHDAILIDQSHPGGIGGQISEPRVASGEVHGSLAAYHTAAGTYLAFNGPPAACPNDAAAAGDPTQIVALRVNPSTATTPIEAGVAWCGSQGGFGAPIVTTTDGTRDALVWGLGGSSNTPPRAAGTGALTAFDGDTGAIVFGDRGANLGGASIQQWVPPIVAKGRLFVATDTRAYAFTLP